MNGLDVYRCLRGPLADPADSEPRPGSEQTEGLGRAQTILIRNFQRPSSPEHAVTAPVLLHCTDPGKSTRAVHQMHEDRSKLRPVDTRQLAVRFFIRTESL